MKNGAFLLLVFLLPLGSCSLFKKAQEPDWCQSKCDSAGDERENTMDLYSHRDSLGNEVLDKPISYFPLRIGVVNHPLEAIPVAESRIIKTVEILNAAFAAAKIQFEIARIDQLQSPFRIEELSDDLYQPYLDFSDQNDLDNTISLYLFDYNPELCKTTGNSVQCGRRGGFSYILSNRTNNVVMSKFDLEDHKIIVHEFGHFFGLYHTFETHQFGKELPNGSECQMTGDAICDTPADPGALYEVYVNYSLCEMVNFVDPETGVVYQPMINNYMSYYKPCYLQPYAFTPQQIKTMCTASSMPMREKFKKR